MFNITIGFCFCTWSLYYLLETARPNELSLGVRHLMKGPLLGMRKGLGYNKHIIDTVIPISQRNI